MDYSAQNLQTSGPYVLPMMDWYYTMLCDYKESPISKTVVQIVQTYLYIFVAILPENFSHLLTPVKLRSVLYIYV